MRSDRNDLMISVVIATHNGSRTIEETLKSCFSQSELPAEVIIVDDASTDDTINVVKKFDFPAIPVKIIQNKKNSGGPAKPFNTGISGASCPLIATLEQDDIWQRDKLALSRRAFEVFPEAGMAYANFYVWFESEKGALIVPDSGIDSETLPQLIPGDEAVKRAMAKQFTQTLSNIVFRKSCWKRAGGIPEKFKICADYAFLSRLISTGSRIVHLPQTLTYYRYHPASIWHSRDYVSRLADQSSVRELLCRAFPKLVDPHIRSELAGIIYDIAFESAKSGKCWQAISFYLWSLRYKAPPMKVFRSIARVLVKLAFGKEYTN